MKIINGIDRYHWVWLLAAAPFIFIAEPAYTPMLLVVPALWVFHAVAEDKSKCEADSSFLPITPLNLSLLIMTSMVLVSLWATFDIAISLEKVSSWVLGIGVFYAMVRLGKQPISWLWSLMAYLGGGFLFTLIGLFSTNWQHRFRVLEPILSRLPKGIPYLPRAESGIHHNALGGTLLWILPVYIVLTVIGSFNREFYSLHWLKGKGWWIRDFIQKNQLVNFIRLTAYLLTLFIGIVFVLSQSRGSYLALGLTIWSMLFLASNERWRWVLSLSFGGLILAGCGLIYTVGWGRVIRFLGLAGQSGFSINSLAGRLEIWSRALQGIQDFPFTGMGMGTFREIVRIVYPIFDVSNESDLVMQAHNEYLQVGLDLGIPGLIGFLSLYFIAFWMLFDCWERSGSANQFTTRQIKFVSHGNETIGNDGSLFVRCCVLGLGGGLLAHFLFGLTDAIILRAPGLFWWMLLGLITGLHRLVAGKESVEGETRYD